MIVGTAGHVDHGKTTLVRALTGVDTDRLAEEKRRGITIELGFARWTVAPGLEVSVVDVPGHEKLVRTMLVGAGGMDAILLVVAADTGVMPQTREHLAACEVLGVRGGVVALTFADRAPDPAAAAAEVAHALEGSFLAGAAIVPVCAPAGQGLDALRAAMARVLAALPPPPVHLPACLPVDRAFTRPGFGTVVTGSLLRGALRVGESVDLLPAGRRLRIRGLHVHGAAVEAATAGQRVAVNLPDVQPEEVERGALLAAPGTATPGNVLDVEVRWLAHAAAPLARASGLTFHLGAGRAVAEVRADAPIPPGGTGTARVRLDRVLALAPGARFVLRGPPDLRHGAVVGGGRVLDAAPPRRREAAVRAALAADPLAVGVLVAEAGERGIAPQTIAARLPVAPRPPGPPLFAASTLAAAADRIVAAVAAWHAERPLDPGMPRARAGEGPLPDAAVERAVAEGRLVREGPILRAPEHEATLDEEGQALARKLLRAIGKAGLAGPRVAELEERFPAPAAQIRDVLAHLERTGRIVRADAFCFPGREARELRRRAAAAVLAGEALGVGWLKEAAGLTRRHAVPLFGWLDACGATRRVGDVRVAGPKAAAFASQPG